MQRFLVAFFMLILISPVGRVLAGSDIPTSSSGATQKKPAQGNGADKARKAPDRAVPYGSVSGLSVGGSTKSAPGVSVSPGEALDQYGRSVSYESPEVARSQISAMTRVGTLHYVSYSP